MQDFEVVFRARWAAWHSEKAADADLLLAGVDLTELERMRWLNVLEDHAWAVGELLGPVSDADLLGAYHRSGGEPGDADTDALCAAIERRNLDV